jgi:hypothetical protein
MNISRPVFIKNDCLYLGDALICVITKTPIDTIQFYIDDYDIKATDDEKFQLYYALNAYYHKIDIRSFIKPK